MKPKPKKLLPGELFRRRLEGLGFARVRTIGYTAKRNHRHLVMLLKNKSGSYSVAEISQRRMRLAECSQGIELETAKAIFSARDSSTKLLLTVNEARDANTM